MTDALKIADCNCLAFRQAARRVTQFYDQFLGAAGLRTTQFSILANLDHRGPVTINTLAEALVMDRTTLGRNILPLVRAGLVATATGKVDRRSKELHLTKAGRARLKLAVKAWRNAQLRFEAALGSKRLAALRSDLRSVAAADLG
jgi:DNA-binding MarR family transcriptional regulator